MTTSNYQCLKLPVYTTSGRYLGKVVDIEVDNLGTRVVFYQVASCFTLAKLWRKKLLISPRQVVSLSNKSMIVRDNELSTETISNLASELT